MSKSNTPLFVVLSTDDMDQSQVEEINSLTRELAQSFENQPEAVQTVSYVQKNELPPTNSSIRELFVDGWWFKSPNFAITGIQIWNC